MSKERSIHREDKKKPLLTAKEKRAVKNAKNAKNVKKRFLSDAKDAK